MFDIGFAELLIIAVVSLLVIGPERLPGTVRTVMAWVHRLRRGFNEIRMEVEQELHNDAVMQELKKTGSEIRSQAQEASREVEAGLDSVRRDLDTTASGQVHPPADTEPASQTDASEAPTPRQETAPDQSRS
ncbi:MAG: twin-arginine translocase subunit TatB [Haliea sp.]|nr:twin-arginine translocase subunit TatB [Haliea sp.]|tara:strand:- start:179894 stop:180289 length:396 start_codon:yes stop_codon:yes gene_type:complete